MNTTTTISNYDDIIDSRDVIARIEELESDRDSWIEDANDLSNEPEFDSDSDDWATEEPADAEELKTLKSLASEASDYASDWQYGEALIRYSYFTDYIMEMLADCGDLPSEVPWYIAIDSEQTAENCKADYTTVDFDGVDYYIR